MAEVYMLGTAIGQNLIPALFFLIAILLVRKTNTAATVLYIIGALLGIMSLLGNAKRIQAIANSTAGYMNSNLLEIMKRQQGTAWLVFAVFALTALAIIISRSESGQKKEDSLEQGNLEKRIASDDLAEESKARERDYSRQAFSSAAEKSSGPVNRSLMKEDQLKRNPVLIASLKSYAKQHDGRELLLKDKPLTIGRANDCDLQYSADTAGVSRYHCKVTWSQNEKAFYVEDLGSSFGSFLMNGQKLTPHIPILLRPGESFYLAAMENAIQLIVRSLN